jgi:hypothetical protein
MTKSFKAIFTFCLFIYSCQQSPKKVDTKVYISIPQRQIQYLVDTFKLAVGNEKQPNEQDNLRIKFAYKFYDLLSNIYIDSIRVHIDTVLVDNLTVTTAFHCNNEIFFRSSLTFLKRMDARQDTLFRFVRGLKPGLDTTVNFAYMGNHEVRLPNSNGIPIIKIFAFPTPIWLPKKE